MEVKGGYLKTRANAHRCVVCGSEYHTPGAAATAADFTIDVSIVGTLVVRSSWTDDFLLLWAKGS
jgi:uncharacterized protein (DUF983 family)